MHDLGGSNCCYRLFVSVAFADRLPDFSNRPTRYELESAKDRLEFVTVEGLLAYGEMLARRTPGEGIALPPIPTSSVDRPQRTRNAMEKIKATTALPIP